MGILGGTFDPVHYGHLRAAVEVGEALELGEVRMLLSARPPHRPQPPASAEHRFEMLRLATGSRGFLVADDSELRRPGPSYMVDTLAGFRERLGDVSLVLIIGQDAANGLDRWHRWRRLFELAHVAVMHRCMLNGRGTCCRWKSPSSKLPRPRFARWSPPAARRHS